MLYQHIQQLQKELDLKEPLGQEGQDSFSLQLDETQISISDSSPGFQLYAKIGALPKEKIEEFFSYMLRGNLFGQATHNAVLGLDETGTDVTVRYLNPQKCEYREFANAIEDFVNTVLFWQDEIKSHPSPTSL